MKKSIAVLLLALVLEASCLAAGAETALFADILCSIDYGEEVTYVIGHKSPDADTIGSAIAYAWLLQQLGINAKVAATAEVNRETRYALDFFGMEQPEILTDAAGGQFVLVDHSEYSQALDGMREARVVGIGSIYTETEEDVAELTEMIGTELRIRRPVSAVLPDLHR